MSYRIIADFHTHTRYSDGLGSIENNVMAAISKGLKTIAITDHGFNHIKIGSKKRKIEQVIKEIDVVRSKYSNIKVLLGVEANLIGINGEIDVPREYLHYYDIILLGFHMTVIPYKLKYIWDLFLRNRINSVTRLEIEELKKSNTQALVNAMERNPINIVTHPGAKALFDIRSLARCAVRHNIALEINSRHDVFRTVKDTENGMLTNNIQIQQKNIDYVLAAFEEGARFVINSDAHSPADVGNFTNALEVAKEARLPALSILNSDESFESNFVWQR